MEPIVEMIDIILNNIDNNQKIESVKEEVHEFMKEFPLYPEIEAGEVATA